MPKTSKRKHEGSAAAAGSAAEVVDLEDAALASCASASASPSKHAHSADYHEFDAQDCAEVRRALLAWYDKKHRKLPWRQSPDGSGAAHPDPYGVWVSEVMLQQTRVETVIPYWTKWMAKWPTVEALAEASLEDVNAAWAGLGYYRRAKYLHEGSKVVARDLGGRLPASAAQLKRIPGIGEYTAGAIASIAFGEAAAVVDGNVVRVLSRLRALPGDPKAAAAVEAHWRLARALLDPARPGDHNQALMELGATLCTPRSPDCGGCPLRARCRALAETQERKSAAGPAASCGVCAGREDAGERTESVCRYPTKAERAKQREEDVAVAVLTGADGGGVRRFLMVQRPAGGLLGGLWEFPAVPGLSEDEMAAAGRRAALDGLLGRLGLPPLPAAASRDELGEVQHVFSHIRQRLVADRVEVPAAYPPSGEGTSGAAGKKKAKKKKKKAKRGEEDEEGDGEGGTSWRWVTEEEMDGMGIPTVARKILALYNENRSSSGPAKGRKRPERPAAAAPGPGQRSIASFFQPKAK